MELVRKGESRCFVFRQEDIQKVIDIVEEIDAFEFDYMPNNWVAVWDYSKSNTCPHMVYNGKFDINVPKLIDECGKKGVGIVIKSTSIDDDCF
jgi:hypothetical protein